MGVNIKILPLTVLVMWGSSAAWSQATDTRGRDAFDPRKELDPEDRPTQVLGATHEAKKEAFPFGEFPQFRLTFSNQSEAVVDLSGRAVDGIRFRPYIFLHILREDGRDVGYGTDLNVATNVSRIAPQGTLAIDFPASDTVAARGASYRRDPNVLLPGKYRCYFQFGIDRHGDSERLLTPLTAMVIVDDGSGDARIATAVQTARGVKDQLELVIQAGHDNLIGLTAQNTGTDPLYLGHDWRWRSRLVGEQDWDEEGGGIRPGGYVTVSPKGTQSLGGVSFRDHKPPGHYTIQARYFDYEGRLQKESNTIIITVR